MNYVYIIRCNDNSLYTGWTNALFARLDAHNEGRGAKYTKGRGPVRLVYLETYEDKSEALKRENEIKKLSRKEKIKLIKNLFQPQKRTSCGTISCASCSCKSCSSCKH